jgi:hypothetical protein
MLERLKEGIEAFKAGEVLENLKKGIEVLTSGNTELEKLKKEIEAIIAFEGFLLGIHEKIDEFTKYVQFRLEQIPDVERNILDTNENLELGKFTIARMREEVLRALQGQAHLNPERVLHFLKNAVQADTA